MILVTGGAGFIGSVLIRELNKLGHKDILIVDRLQTSTKWMNLRQLKYASYIPAHELFSNIHTHLLHKIKSIYHMGACSATTETNMDYLMENNVDYSKRLLSFATERKISIVYASSAATYGDGQQGYSDDHSKLFQLRPLNRYGYSKQLVDEWVLNQRRSPYSWYGVKFFNVYGPNEYHKEFMHSVVYKTFKEVQNEGKVKLFKSHKADFKDGEQRRDFVYVKDVVRAMIALMELKRPEASGIYNLGSGHARTFNDLASQVFVSLKKEKNIEYIPMPDSLKNHYQYHTQADMSKFKNLLPEFSFSTLEEGIHDYVAEYLLKDYYYC